MPTYTVTVANLSLSQPQMTEFGRFLPAPGDEAGDEFATYLSERAE